MSATYFTIKTPDGHLIHTHLSTTEQDSIENLLHEERMMYSISNMGARLGKHDKGLCCTPSWEAYEAEGYSIVKVSLTEVK